MTKVESINAANKLLRSFTPCNTKLEAGEFNAIRNQIADELLNAYSQGVKDVLKSKGVDLDTFGF